MVINSRLKRRQLDNKRKYFLLLIFPPVECLTLKQFINLKATCVRTIYNDIHALLRQISMLMGFNVMKKFYSHANCKLSSIFPAASPRYRSPVTEKPFAHFSNAEDSNCARAIGKFAH